MSTHMSTHPSTHICTRVYPPAGATLLDAQLCRAVARVAAHRVLLDMPRPPRQTIGDNIQPRRPHRRRHHRDVPTLSANGCYIGLDYIGHIGHNYIRHDYVGHNYIGRNDTGTRRSASSCCRRRSNRTTRSTLATSRRSFRACCRSTRPGSRP